MTIVSPMGQLRPIFADKNGKRLSGGKVFTYEPGTLTPKATYSDALGTIPNPNPINLDKSGEADIYLTGDCRVRVFDKHGVMIDDHDNLKLLPSKAYLDAILSGFASGASKFYLTLAQANADIANIAVNQPVNIGELENGGLWYKESANSIALTKTPYDTLDLARSYSDQKQVVQEEYIDELFEGKSQQIEQSLASQTQYVETAISQQGVSLQQLDNYYNYLMQRIAAIAVEKGWDASFVMSADGSNQQQINDRIGNKWYEKPLGYSINDRVMLENGDIVKSTVANNTIDPNIDMSGWVNPSKDQKDLNDKLTSINQLRISPKWFGSPNNGVDDDAQGIRAAIAFIKLNGGGILDLESKTEWMLKTKHSIDDCHFVIDFQNFAFDGGTQTSKLKSYISVETQVLLKDGISFLAFLNTDWNGNYLANYNVKTEDNKFAPYLYTLNSTFFVTNIAAMRVNTYVSNFTLTRWGFSGDGLQINPNGDTATSLSFNSSYAQNCSGSGFKTIGSVIYSVFNACASDHCDISYDLNYCNVVVLNGCGSEQTRKPLKITNSASVIVNGICLLGCGSTDTLNPIDALIDVTDSRLILDGYRNLTMEGRATYYTKEAKTLGWGFIDARRSQSLSRRNVSKGIHVDYESTIWCFDDETHADQTFNVAPSDLAAFITDNLRDRIINHKLTIQLSGGTESSSSAGKALRNMKGYGSVVIQGSSSDRTAVTLLGAHYRLQAVNNTCNIVLKNLKIQNGDSSDREFHQLRTVDSRDIILDNVEIAATGMVGAAIYASGNTKIKLINTSEPTQTASGNYTATGVFVAENGAEIIHEARAAMPTTGYFGRSIFIPAKQNASEILGWYCDGSGSTVSGWKTHKVYSA